MLYGIAVGPVKYKKLYIRPY